MNRRHRPLFDDEQLNATMPTAPPLPPVSYFNVGYKNQQPVITPPPQNIHPPFPTHTEWTDRSESSTSLIQFSESQNQLYQTVVPLVPSQNIRRQGSTPHSRSGSTASNTRNLRSRAQESQQGNKKVPEKKKNYPSQKKASWMIKSLRENESLQQNVQQNAPADKKTDQPQKSDNKRAVVTKVNGRPKKVEENIGVIVRTIMTRSQTRENRNRIPLRERAAGGDKTPKRGQRKVVEKEKSCVAKEGDRVEEIMEAKVEEEEQPVLKTPEPQLLIVEKTAKTPEQQLLMNRCEEEEMEKMVESIISTVETMEELPKPEPLSETVPKMTDNKVSDITEPAQSGQSSHEKEAITSKRTSSLEADLGIGQCQQSTCLSPRLFERASTKRELSHSPILKQKLSNSPKTTPTKKKSSTNSPLSSPKPVSDERSNKTRYLEIVAQMDKARNAAAQRKRHIMFLPTAFDDLFFTESIMTQLYGKFQVTDVCMHHDKNGARLGSGSMKVLVDSCDSVRNWATDFQWRAIKALPVRHRNASEATLYLIDLPHWEDDQIEEKLKKDFEATKFQMLYHSNGKSTFSAIACMSRENALKLNRRLRSPDETVFDEPNTVSIFELPDI